MRSKIVEDFFSDAEKDKIRVAVENVEKRSSGEIATMVVENSDSYREAETLGAILVAGLLALLVEVLVEYLVVTAALGGWSNGSTLYILYGISVWTYVPLVFLLYFPSKQLFKALPRLKLSFVGRKRIDEAVRERAVRAFYEKRLHKTRDETGVLIFISIMERKVWILADRGIDKNVPQGFFSQLANRLSAGLREKQPCKALCAVIEMIGQELSVQFPRRSDDINELSDSLLHDSND